MDLKWVPLPFPSSIPPGAMGSSNIANPQPSSKTMSVRNLCKIVTDLTGVTDVEEREKEKKGDRFNRRPQNGEAGNYISSHYNRRIYLRWPEHACP
ncbi:hypothetical protein ACN42_g1186 [Penicillium freii]|uniref:Uncharacterized protein n=1 Tax=Penicillium freii TaxID=48697 RepID=A0A101MSG8_PENFR|nr:hypothetical protein ACN42_g1186 [Penicillium freii]